MLWFTSVSTGKPQKHTTEVFSYGRKQLQGLNSQSYGSRFDNNNKYLLNTMKNPSLHSVFSMQNKGVFMWLGSAIIFLLTFILQMILQSPLDCGLALNNAY